MRGENIMREPSLTILQERKQSEEERKIEGGGGISSQ